MLIVRIGSLGANTTDVFEDLGEFLIGELETHHGTFVQEVQFHNKFVVRWIKLLIGLLYCVAFLFQLLAEFVNQVVCIVKCNVILEETSLVEALEEFKVVKVLVRVLLLIRS